MNGFDNGAGAPGGSSEQEYEPSRLEKALLNLRVVFFERLAQRLGWNADAKRIAALVLTLRDEDVVQALEREAEIRQQEAWYTVWWRHMRTFLGGS